jgi:mannan endo-1,4-beta-mannosidase
VTRQQAKSSTRQRGHRSTAWIGAATCAALLIGAVIFITATKPSGHVNRPHSANSQPVPYLGVFERDAPYSYAGVKAFTKVTGVSPDVLLYFSPWGKPFQTGFATSAAENGAVPLVQIDPTGISLAAVSAGRYDHYLRVYAKAVRSYGRPVILSFGHEMNGTWYSWGYQHESPGTFVAAWRHIVTSFRDLRVRNVTWMWTVNIIAIGGIPSTVPWWPGKSYVNWVGIDGYYYSPSWTFASLFGPTIAAVRGLTGDPILIAETGATPGESQSAKITNLFAGVRLYGLLGFVWFDIPSWHITSPAAASAFRRGAKFYQRPAR